MIHTRTRLLSALFSEHPRTTGETYAKHAATAARFGFEMIAGGVQCLIHAVVPGVYERAASDRVAMLHAQLEARRRSMDVDPDYVI